MIQNGGKQPKKHNNKKKLKQVKCKNCKNVMEYYIDNCIRIGEGSPFIECDFCGKEIVVK